MSNILSITFKSSYCNGFPFIKIKLNDVLLCDFQIDNEDYYKDILLENNSSIIEVERYNKTNNNIIIENNKVIKDQILEIVDIKIDGIKLPDFIIYEHSVFNFMDQEHTGSTYFAPNGIWKFKFKSPIITWVLDQKIKHEAKYSDYHKLDFSYKIDPEKIASRLDDFENYLNMIEKYDV